MSDTSVQNPELPPQLSAQIPENIVGVGVKSSGERSPMQQFFGRWVGPLFSFVPGWTETNEVGKNWIEWFDNKDDGRKAVEDISKSDVILAGEEKGMELPWLGRYITGIWQNIRLVIEKFKDNANTEAKQEAIGFLEKSSQLAKDRLWEQKTIYIGRGLFGASVAFMFFTAPALPSLLTIGVGTSIAAFTALGVYSQIRYLQRRKVLLQMADLTAQKGKLSLQNN